MIKSLKSRFTMKQTGEYFIDIVSINPVFYWVDCYDEMWMAERRWGVRVKSNRTPQIK